jgi:hypothetical protein
VSSSSIEVPVTIIGIYIYRCTWTFIKYSDKVLKCNYYFNSYDYDKVTRLILISGLEYEVRNRSCGYIVWFRSMNDIDRYLDILNMVFGRKYICVDREVLMEYFGE